MISMVVAQADNRVIGLRNELPWYLPADLRRFREITTGHAVVMGRKTYDSIVARLGKPLPHRTNIVITHNQEYQAPGAIVVHSLDEALRQAGDGEVFVIGGEAVFTEALPRTDKVYLTKVHAHIEGDVYFPELGSGWIEKSREPHRKDDKNPYDYDFVVLERAK